MPSLNHNPIKGYAAGFVPPNPARDLAAYDALPLVARRALDEAPFAISAEQALAEYRKNGEAAVMHAIQESVDQWLDAASKETGVPKPVGQLVRRKRR